MIGQRILATLLALPALLVLIGGIRNLMTAWQASYSGGYWIEHDYMGNGVMMLVSAMIGLGCCLQLGHRMASWAWSVIPAGIALFALVMPNMTHHPESQVPVWKASHRTTQGVRMLVGEVKGLAQASGTFVCPPPPEVIHASVFAHQGKRLLYEVRCVSNASGPFLDEPAPERPGVLVMAVSLDGRQAWFTATSLDAEVSDRAVWLLARDHTPFSVEAHV